MAKGKKSGDSLEEEDGRLTAPWRRRALERLLSRERKSLRKWAVWLFLIAIAMMVGADWLAGFTVDPDHTAATAAEQGSPAAVASPNAPPSPEATKALRKVAFWQGVVHYLSKLLGEAAIAVLIAGVLLLVVEVRAFTVQVKREKELQSQSVESVFENLVDTNITNEIIEQVLAVPFLYKSENCTLDLAVHEGNPKILIGTSEVDFTVRNISSHPQTYFGHIGVEAIVVPFDSAFSTSEEPMRSLAIYATNPTRCLFRYASGQRPEGDASKNDGITVDAKAAEVTENEKTEYGQDARKFALMNKDEEFGTYIRGQNQFALKFRLDIGPNEEVDVKYRYTAPYAFQDFSNLFVRYPTVGMTFRIRYPASFHVDVAAAHPQKSVRGRFHLDRSAVERVGRLDKGILPNQGILASWYPRKQNDGSEAAPPAK